jgi:hypothetical protein
MIGRPPRRLRLNTAEPELGKIECLNERIDHTNRIILIDPVIEALRQERRLTAIRPLDKALHPVPANHLRRGRESQRADHQKTAFLHSQGHLSPLRPLPACPLTNMRHSDRPLPLGVTGRARDRSSKSQPKLTWVGDQFLQ